MKRSYLTGLILLILLVVSLSKSIFGQEWTEPVNISNLEGYIKQPDMVIDHSNKIHLVWSQKVGFGHWLILYTFSEDDGLTWTEPFNLLQNSGLSMCQPQITCDSKNNLYVTYTHDDYGITPEGRLIKMLIWDGHQWSEPIFVSEGMPGSNHSTILIDQNDNPFIFWLIGSQMGAIDMYYRYYEKETWSDIFCPFCDSTYAYLPLSPSTENEVVHWAGEQQTNIEKPVYFIFTTKLNAWEKPEMINKDTINVDVDISLNTSNAPEIVYRKISTIAVGETTDSTMHTKKEWNLWLSPYTVSGTDKRQKGQQIAIDQNNDVHIVETEYYNSTELETELVHYYKVKNTWFSQSIDSSDNLCNMPKLVFSNNKLYVVYVWDSDELNQRYIRFSKYDVLTSVNNPGQQKQGLDIYPNPGSDNIYIEFKNKDRQHINLAIFDMTGKMITTLTNKLIPSGKQKFIWNGTDQNGNKVINGSYIVRLKAGQKSIAQKVEIVR